MSGRADMWRGRVSPPGLGGQMAWVVLSVLVSAAMWLPLAYLRAGFGAVLSALAAASVCLASGALALLFAGLMCRAGQVVGGTLAGMGLRLVLPLAVIVVVYRAGSSLAAAGMVYDILFFYAVILVTETWLSVRQALATCGPQGGTD